MYSRICVFGWLNLLLLSKDILKWEKSNQALKWDKVSSKIMSHIDIFLYFYQTNKPRRIFKTHSLHTDQSTNTSKRQSEEVKRKFQVSLISCYLLYFAKLNL